MGDGHNRRILGMLGGFAAYFGPPVITYLLALKVAKEEFISCAAMLYLIGIDRPSRCLLIKGYSARKN